jgi:hypothetical protein
MSRLLLALVAAVALVAVLALGTVADPWPPEGVPNVLHGGLPASPLP